MKPKEPRRQFAGAANNGIHIINTAKPANTEGPGTAQLQAVGLLAAGVAHDLNSLLGVVLGYCEELTRQQSMPQAAHSMVAEIANAGTAARKLTGGLLALSTGALSQSEVVNLNEAILRMGPILSRMVGKRVTWSEHLGKDLGLIAVGAGQLEQILINLSMNARDAMPKGGTLSVETANAYLDEAYAREHPRVPAGSYVRLSVSDSGSGMDAETQARVFEVFFTTKPQEQGTGLGLATVASIVKNSNGNISVHSRPGCGTTFHIHFPRIEQPEIVPLPGLASYPPGAAAMDVPTVLVVEDSTSLRALTRRFLEDAGYRVLDAGNACEALAQASASTIQLLITDVTLPGMSGLELALKLSGLQPAMSVLLISGHCDGKQFGTLPVPVPQAYLGKPFTREKLLAAAGALLHPPVKPA